MNSSPRNCLDRRQRLFSNKSANWIEAEDSQQPAPQSLRIETQNSEDVGFLPRHDFRRCGILRGGNFVSEIVIIGFPSTTFIDRSGQSLVRPLRYLSITSILRLHVLL